MSTSGEFFANPFNPLTNVPKDVGDRYGPRSEGPNPNVKARCNSYYEGQFEDRLWRPVGDGTKRGARRRIGAIMKAAKRFDDLTRKKRKETNPGARIGALGPISLAVLEKMYDIVCFKTGRLEPSARFLAQETGYSYEAVRAALRRLWEHGFLRWWRRSKKTNNEGQAGPQVMQITNAYVLILPAALEAFVQRLIGRSPLSSDAAWSRDEEKRQFNDMLLTLSAVEMVEATFEGDLQLGHSLKALAAALDARDAKERESNKATQFGRI